MYHYRVPGGFIQIFCDNVTFCFTKSILIFSLLQHFWIILSIIMGWHESYNPLLVKGQIGFSILFPTLYLLLSCRCCRPKKKNLVFEGNELNSIIYVYILTNKQYVMHYRYYTTCSIIVLINRLDHLDV